MISFRDLVALVESLPLEEQIIDLAKLSTLKGDHAERTYRVRVLRGKKRGQLLRFHYRAVRPRGLKGWPEATPRFALWMLARNLFKEPVAR